METVLPGFMDGFGSNEIGFLTGWRWAARNGIRLASGFRNGFGPNRATGLSRDRFGLVWIGTGLFRVCSGFGSGSGRAIQRSEWSCCPKILTDIPECRPCRAAGCGPTAGISAATNSVDKIASGMPGTTIPAGCCFMSLGNSSRSMKHCFEWLGYSPVDETLLRVAR